MESTPSGLIKIAIVGPESTGKSVISEQLAMHYQTNWVIEMARPYLNNLNRRYTFDDVEAIARAQVKVEDQMMEETERLLFCDTTLLVIKVWMEFAGWQCPDWILDEVQNRHYDLHLLMDIDLPWQDDPLREHPGKRKELMDIYVAELEALNTPYKIVNGEGKIRVDSAIGEVERILKS